MSLIFEIREKSLHPEVGTDAVREVAQEVAQEAAQEVEQEPAQDAREAAQEAAQVIAQEAAQVTAQALAREPKKAKTSTDKTHEAPGLGAGPWVVKAVAKVITQLSQKPGGSWRTTRFDSSCAPRESVEDYSAKLHEQLCCSPECFVFAFIYLDRYLEADTGRLSVTNVHRLLLTSLRISTKVFDDHYRSMRSCAAIGGVRAKELVNLEACFLRRIDWRVYVAPEECEECLAALACLDASQLAKAVRRRPGMTTTDDVPIFAPVARLLQCRQAPAVYPRALEMTIAKSKLMGNRKVKALVSSIRMPRRVLHRRKAKAFGHKIAMMPSAIVKLAQKVALLRSVKVASRAAGEALLRRKLGERWRPTCSLSLAAAGRGAFRDAALIAAR